MQGGAKNSAVKLCDRRAERADEPCREAAAIADAAKDEGEEEQAAAGGHKSDGEGDPGDRGGEAEEVLLTNAKEEKE